MPDTTSRRCHVHGTKITPGDAECPDCLDDYAKLPDPATMTGDERVAEMEAWRGILEIDFDKLHGRFEALVGRPVWTHEMGSHNKHRLNEEARARTGTLDWGDVLGAIPPRSEVVVVKVNGKEG